MQVVVQPPATLDIVFLPGSVLASSEVLGAWSHGELLAQEDVAAAVQEQGIAVGDTMQPAIHTAVDAFEDRLGEQLQLQPAKVQTAPGADTEREVEWSALATRFALSNMVGCITRFHGSMRVATDVGGFESESHAAAPSAPSAPHTLFSGMPSRTLFPRGFLWDEGFHQLLVMKWRPQLSMQVIESWFATQQADAERGTVAHGWIAREQILGEEALTRVPPRFAVQRPDIANPPTMLLALRQLLAAPVADLEPWLRRLYPALQRWYAWFLRTQRTGTRVRELEQGWSGTAQPSLAWLQARKALSGEEPQLFLDGRLAAGGWDGQDQRGFQWQGSSPDHTFACGLDDSPRGVVPTDKDEHLDLLAWMVFAARTLRDVARLLGNSAHEQLFQADEAKFQSWMDRHWSPDAQDGTGWFCDVGAEAVFPEMRHPRTQQVAPQEISLARAGSDHMVRHFLRSQTLSQAQASALEPGARIGHVCHRSYLALFPLLLQSLPAGDRRLLPLVRAVTQGDMLGPGGVKSLSSASPLFGSKDDYWRGKAWMNINYLLVQGLEHYAAAPLASAPSSDSEGEGGDAKEGGAGVLGSLLQWATGSSGARSNTGTMSADEWASAQQEAAAAAATIRRTIVGNMVHKYETQGSLFENYEADRGMGTGTAPFTGWTGAVLPLLSSAREPGKAAAAVAAVGSDGQVQV